MIPFVCTLIACLVYSIEFGILIGVGINIAFVLYNIARPNILVYNRKVSMIFHDELAITSFHRFCGRIDGFLLFSVERPRNVGFNTRSKFNLFRIGSYKIQSVEIC